jgi:hypothetical protein
VSPSPTTVLRVWRDSDPLYGEAMTQFSHLARREKKTRTTRGMSFRKSTELGHDKTHRDQLLDEPRTV